MIKIFYLSVSFYQISIFAQLRGTVVVWKIFLKSVQKRALRYIYNEYVSSYAELRGIG